MAGKVGQVVEKLVGVAVGAYAGQGAADFSGAQAVRNGIATGIGVTLLGAAGWAFGKPRSFVKVAGEGLALGAGAWMTGVGGQHMDQAILTASKSTGTTSTAAAEQNAAAIRAQQAAAAAAQRAVVPQPQPMSSGRNRSVDGGSGGRPVQTYQYPED